MGAGIKYDNGKRQWALMPFDQVEEILKVLEFGAIKYAPDNWKYVEDSPRRYYEALMRHLLEWKKQFDKGDFNTRDHESDLLTLGHVGCCLLFLMWHVQGMENGESPIKPSKNNKKTQNIKVKFARNKKGENKWNKLKGLFSKMISKLRG